MLNRDLKNKKLIILAFAGGLIVAGCLSIWFFFPGTSAEMKFKPYYSGDATVYQNKIIVSSTDTGSLEIFQLADNKLIKQAEVSPLPDQNSPFFSSILQTENNHLYAYAVNGRYLLKYDLGDLATPILVSKIKDNSWDWFLQLRKTGNNIVTIGTKSIKIWNNNLDVINEFKKSDKENKEIYFSSDSRLMFEVNTDYQGDKENDFLNIIDGQTRQIIMNPQIVINNDNYRSVYYDTINSLAYVAGDRVLKQINLATQEIKDFKHIAEFGYDTAGVSGKDHFYFSDGIGVVKISHELKPLKWVFSKDLKIADSWAMRLAVVEQNGREKVVVFNNSNIAILDENLKLVASYLATEKNDAPAPAIEPLSLALDYNRAPRLARINLSGTGFGTNEYLEIGFIKNNDTIGEVIKTQADGNGRFNVSLVVPNTLPSHLAYTAKYPLPLDIKATGLVSGSHYSIGFTIE
ncbi:MAG: hypothetical protein WCV41_00380 [Patescibacteria group bacterium]